MKSVYKILLSVIFLTLFLSGKIGAETLESADVNASYPQLTNIPTIYINTTNSIPVTSKDYYIPGALVAVSSDSKETLLGIGSGVSMEIRGRGNSTWGKPKSPYRIKFEKKTNFLNLPAHAKSWVLLANYFDKSLIRNAVAMKISELVGLEFTPASKFVDLVLNGDYIGTYWVSDQVEVREKRVEVEEQDYYTTTLPNLSGGYLLEVDGFAEREPAGTWFITSKNVKVTIKYPKNEDEESAPKLNPQQYSYIVNFTQRVENAVFSSNFKDPVSGYRPLVDVNSLVNWYIACELTGNSDAFFSANIYKRRNIDKFFFGPLWDYDIAFNNDSRLGDATEKLMREYAHNGGNKFRDWIQQLWKDEWFRDAVYRRWAQLVNEEKILDKLTAYVNTTAALIDASQKRNYQRWPNTLNTKVYMEQFLFTTYSGYTNYLKTYLSQRVNFLTNSFTAERPVMPFVATNSYYRITNLGSGNAIQVRNQSNAVGAVLEMWAPQTGNNYQEWRVVSVGNNKYQIINRKTGLAMAGNGRQQNLIQTTPNPTNPAQQWYITAVNHDLYGVVNVSSGYSINNKSGGTGNGTDVIEYDNAITGTSLNQKWYFTITRAIESETKINFTLPVTNVTYGSMQQLSLSATSNNNTTPIVYASSNNDVAEAVATTLHIKKTGTVTVTASQIATDAYYAGFSTQTLTVAKKSLIVKANDVEMICGDDLPQFTLSYSGFVNGENESVLDELPQGHCNVDINCLAGEYPIQVTGGAGRNYNITRQNGTLTIFAQVGVVNNIEACSVTAYPNPVVDYLSIQSNHPIEKVELYNQLGVCALIASKVGETINLSALPDGIYYIKIFVNNQVITRKVIKTGG